MRKRNQGPGRDAWPRSLKSKYQVKNAYRKEGKSLLGSWISNTNLSVMPGDIWAMRTRAAPPRDPQHHTGGRVP